jgi:signal transduction histidine kinase
MATIQDTARRATGAVRDLDSASRGTRPTRRQALVTGGWLLVMLATTSVRTGGYERLDAPLALAVVGVWAPLLLRTYRPALALAGTLVTESTVLAFLTVPDALARETGGMGAYQPVPLATMLAVATLAARVPRRTGWVVGIGAGLVLMVVGLTVQSTETALTDLVVFYLVVTAAAAGVWRSGRRDHAERMARERAEHAQQAVLDERLRIARELHDVLAHNLTLVNAQAGVARYLLRTDPAAAERALRDITTHTGRAVDELRATIGLMRRRDDEGATGPDDGRRPVPGMGDVDQLVASFRAAGTQVDVTTDGTPVALSQQVELAAYRIVQEAVTNAAKHAPGAVVDVRIAWTDAGVRLRIANALDREPDRPRAPGTGNGLIGMRERAAAAGGTLRAGATREGGFEVVATLPAGTTGLGGPPDPTAPRPGGSRP